MKRSMLSIVLFLLLVSNPLHSNPIFYCNPVIDEVEKVEPSNCGVNDGELKIFASGGSGQYVYSIDGGLNWQPENSFSGLPAGAYSVGVKNVDGSCPVFYQEPVELFGPDSPRFIEVLTTDPSNCEDNDGTISITAEGGTGPYFYSINGGQSWELTSFYSDLSSGIYTAMVKNADGTCPTTYVLPIELTAPAAPVITDVSFDHPMNCEGNDGSIIIEASGMENLLYSIDNGNSWQENGSYYELTAGIYKVLIQYESETCITSAGEIILISETLPEIDGIQFLHPSDCNLSDGSVEIVAVGESGEDLFSIDGGISWNETGLFTGLSAGVYNVQVRKQGSTCIVNAGQIILKEPPSPELIALELSDPTDCGAFDGMVIVNASGDPGQLQFSINGGTSWQEENVFTGLPEGVYTIDIRNADGTCQINSESFMLNDPVSPEFSSITAISPSDCNLADGSIIISTIPSNAEIEYSIDAGNSFFNFGIFENLAAGDYEVWIRNTDGSCPVGEGSIISLIEPANPEITEIHTINPSDCGTADGIIDVAAIGGFGNLRFSIDNGGSWQSSGYFENLQSGEYQVSVMNQDGTCISEIQDITLLEPAGPVIFDVEFEGVSDCELSDGEIFISTASGIQFSINGGASWQTEPVFSELAEGYYKILLKNPGSACLTETNTIQITALDLPEIDLIEKHDPTDCNENNGKIWIHVTGNADDFVYSLNSGNSWQTSNVFEDLAPGIYSVSIKNADGSCELLDEMAIELIAPDWPVLEEIFVTHVPFCDPEGGVIELKMADISSGFQFSINGGISWQQQNLFTNLPSGDYQLLIKNQNGSCLIESELIQIQEAPMPELEEVITINPTACDAEDGQVYIFTNEGPYEFSIDNGESWQNSSYFQNLPTGHYELLIRLENSTCFEEMATLILEGPEIPVIQQVDVQNPTNCEAPDGSVFIQLENLEPYFEYSIDNGQNWQDGPLFEHLPPGIYKLWVRNTLEPCEVFYDEIQLSGSEFPHIDEVEIKHPSDCNVPDGKIKIYIPQTESSFLFSIDGGLNWQASNEFEFLMAGTYSLLIKDQTGSCQLEWGSIELLDPMPPVIEQITLSDPSDCNQENGSIQILTTSSQSIEYSINNGLSWQFSPDFTDLAAGQYEIRIKESNSNCISEILPVTLELPAAEIPVNFLIVSPSDCDTPDGKVELIAEGPGSPFEYSLDDGQTWQESPLFSGLQPGSYSVLVRSQMNDCLEGSLIVELESPELPYLSQIESLHPTNCVSSNGVIMVSAGGGLGAYQFSIDNGISWHNSGNFENLPPGIYSVAIRNGDGTCSIFDTNPIELSAPPEPEIELIEINDASDCHLDDGSLVVLGEYPSFYEFSLDNGQSWQTTGAFENLEAGTYNLQIKNSVSDCILEYENMEIASPKMPKIETIITNPVSGCWQNDGSLEIIPVIPNSNYEYSIDGGITWFSTATFTELSPGEVIVSLRNADGSCSSELRAVTIEGSPPPQINDVIIENPTNCEGDNGQIQIVVEDIETDLLYSIDNGSSWSEGHTFENLTAGEYAIKIKNAGGTCEFTFQQLISLFEVAEIDLEIVEKLQPDCFDGVNGMIAVQAKGGIPPYEYLWSNGENTFLADGLSAGDYEVSIFDSRGCFSVFEILLENPSPFEIELGEAADTLLCLGQSLVYNFEDLGIDFNWGSSTGLYSNVPSLTITEAGFYWLEVENELGCKAKDTIEVVYSEAFFDADFLLPVEGVANTPIVMIDISWPIPDSISWEYDASIIEQQQSGQDHEIVIMSTPGIYSFTMKAHSGECYGELQKDIEIFETTAELSNEPLDQFNSNVLEFNLAPNPNNGVFKAEILLGSDQPIELWVINPDGIQFDHRQLEAGLYFEESYNLNDLLPGVYSLVLQTGSEWLYLNFMIN